jgi:hypothetical protein
MSISLPLSGPGNGAEIHADDGSCGWNGPDAALKWQYAGPAVRALGNQLGWFLVESVDVRPISNSIIRPRA